MNALQSYKRKRVLVDNKGFSLVELIIVIAIMAVLVATLAPQYTKYVERAKVQTDLTALSELKQAIVLACIDPINKQYPNSVVITGSAGGTISYTPTEYTAGADGIKDDIQVVIGDTLNFTSATCKARTYTITVSDANNDGVWDFTTNWNSDGKLNSET